MAKILYNITILAVFTVHHDNLAGVVGWGGVEVCKQAGIKCTIQLEPVKTSMLLYTVTLIGCY